MKLSVLILLTGLLGPAGLIAAQPNRPPRLSPVPADYNGTYAYHGRQTLQLLPQDTLLVAIIDDAEYPLRQAGPDRFVNRGGDTIPFRRAADGRIEGFSERKVFYRRLSAETARPPASMYARRGPDGRVPRYAYQPPASLGDGLPVAALAAAATMPLQQMVQAIADEQYPGVHSVLIWKDGRLVLEEYFYGYDARRLHQLRSASKSFVSALVGVAVDQKLLGPEAGERVLPHFTYAGYQHPDPRKQAWTVQDFLTMRTGLACNDNDPQSEGNEEKMYSQADWVKFVLDLPLVAAPGTQGSYCSGAVAVLGKTVEAVARQPLPAFAEAHLFRPLGISSYRWNYQLDAANPTVAQLYLSSRDMLKFGVLYLQKGQWQGRQVLSAGWVARSLQAYGPVGSKQYGYFWWQQQFTVAGQPTPVLAYMATGNGGQKIYVLPSLNAVVVFTGGNYNAARDTPPNELMPRFVLPALLGL
jgi:CubicO group peptidase (beta-lactamase class C family)